MRKKSLMIMLGIVWLVYVWRNLRRGPGRYDLTKPVSENEWLAEKLRIERQIREMSNGHYVHDD